MTAVYSIYMERHVPKQGLAAALVETFGPGGKILAALILFWTVTVMGWAAALADRAFPMVDGFPVLGWVLLALAAWGCGKGPAACARCCGVLSLFLGGLYGVILLMAAPDVTWAYLKPTDSWLQGIWGVGLFLLPAGAWFVAGNQEGKGLLWLELILPVLAALLAAVTAGVLSPELAATRQVPLYDVAQSVSLFGVVERMEPLLSAAMTMGAFGLLSTLVCAAKALMDQLRPWNGNGAAACVAAAAAMFLTKDLPVELLSMGCIVLWMIIPLLVTALGRK